MKTPNKKDALERLAMLLEDCEAQSGSLAAEGDTNWDCYNCENWDGMIESINLIMQYVRGQQ